MAFSEEELAEVRPLAAPVVQFFQDRWQLEYVEKIGDPTFIERLVTDQHPSVVHRAGYSASGCTTDAIEQPGDFVIVEPGGTVIMDMFL
jgi:hypothetical protein